MRQVVVHWPADRDEHGGKMLWFGSWLVGAEGAEAGWFYSGRGGESGSYEIPAEATGIRVRRWPNEGLEPEYADIVPLNGAGELSAGDLDFDHRQQFSRLPADFM
jgi:hypothetical protein